MKFHVANNSVTLLASHQCPELHFIRGASASLYHGGISAHGKGARGTGAGGGGWHQFHPGKWNLGPMPSVEIDLTVARDLADAVEAAETAA